MNSNHLISFDKDKQDRNSSPQKAMFANYEIFDYKNNLDLTQLKIQLEIFSSSLKFIGHSYVDNNVPIFLFHSQKNKLLLSNNLDLNNEILV